MHLSHPGRSASTFHCVDALIPFAENAQGRLLFRVQPRDALAPCNLRGRRKRAEVEIRSNFKFWDPLPRKNERDARPPDFRERRGRGRSRIDRAVLELETSRHRFPCRLRLRPTSPSCLRRRAGSGRDVYPLAHIQGRPLKPNTLHGPGGPRAYAARPYAALGPAPPHIFGCSGGFQNIATSLSTYKNRRLFRCYGPLELYVKRCRVVRSRIRGVWSWSQDGRAEPAEGGQTAAERETGQAKP
ncbi:unnamed protein product [Nesidiocoris tenuis]|uniref:Uncharacterized protein n=1 Tax=Nesidiocoris tenuis TaxID=355587 RepID=A0A6H5GLB5_9HEMI|nr:unnamed protein product [Nesidiocoris tenuis]